jgi:misacylated tRNA(Ala) deacylase
MTTKLYGDAYATRASGRVLAHTDDGGIILDQSLFYATGGGQPGDGGALNWSGGTVQINTAVKADSDHIALIPEGQGPLPEVGTEVEQVLDWDRRFAHMRVHTMLHLLSVVIPLEVSGGSVSAAKGRLDFNMPEAPADKAALEAALQDLIDRDLLVIEEWITEAELAANPGLVKTMSVSPPRGAGHIRLVRIGQGADQVDLQPCGGTHVRNTAEIGALEVRKIEKKGRQNRRVSIQFKP